MFIPKIECSTDYESFHCIPQNRQLSQKHIERLISDPTFPTKYCTSPILVDPKRNILDGQHRYHACIRLNLPIFFLVDPDGKPEDILHRNDNQLRFTGMDIVNFHAHTIEDYKKIMQLKEHHKVNLSVISAAIRFFGGYKHISYFYEMRKGNVRIWSFIKHLEDFLDIYVPLAKDFLNAKGKEHGKILLVDSYVTSLASFFRDDKPKFKKLVARVMKFPHPLVYSNKHDIAREQLQRVINWNGQIYNKSDKTAQMELLG